jgi:hypothetical protein
MRSIPLSAALAVALAVSACSDDPGPTATIPVFGIAGNGDHATVPLSGNEEVPARKTQAHGTATFQLSDDGLSLSYTLTVKKISNVVQAHIHVGPAGENGPIVLFLYGLVASGGGEIKKDLLATGTKTAADLVGPLVGMTLADLLAEMQSGNAYVNVHTNDGVDPANTGPGDFPGGEIRGQIR